jgi:hypothetical protein
MHLFRTLRWVWPVVTLALLGYGLHVALTVPPDADQGNIGRNSLLPRSHVGRHVVLLPDESYLLSHLPSDERKISQYLVEE